MSLEALLNRIQNDMYAAKPRITNKMLAKEIKAEESTISRSFSSKKISFHLFSRILGHVYKDTFELRYKYIQEYIDKNEKRSNRHELLEFLNARGEYKLLCELIHREKQYGHKIDIEWAGVYELLLQIAENSISKPKLLARINELIEQCETVEMLVLVKIIWCQSMVRIHDFRILLECSKEIESKITKIRNELIRNSFQLRIKQIVGYALLIRNRVNEARTVFLEALHICELDYTYTASHARSNWILGESYIFEDYEKSRNYFYDSLELLKNLTSPEMKKKKAIVIDTLDFLRIYWMKDLDQLSTDINDAEKAFLKAKLGDRNEALEILDTLEKKNGNLSPFQLCYKGIAEHDMSIVKESLSQFMDNGNVFYSQLPKIVLETNGHMV